MGNQIRRAARTGRTGRTRSGGIRPGGTHIGRSRPGAAARGNLEALEARHLLTGVVSFADAEYAVDEDSGVLEIEVTRAEGAGTSTVNFTVTEGSATAGADYVAENGSVTFAEGEDTQTITVTINDDPDIEIDETFVVTLSDPVEATLGEVPATTVTIRVNDDLRSGRSDDHPNSVGITAGPLVLGESSRGNLETLGDADFFQFEAVAGDNFRIQTTLLGLSDSTIALHDSDGNQLAFNDDFAGTLASQLFYDAPTDGTYYVEVRAYSDSSTGTYQLSLDSVEDDFGSTPDSASPIDVDTTIEAEIEFPGDVDFFSFDLVEGQFYEIRTRLGSLQDTRLTLYDANGGYVIANTNTGINAFSSRLVWQAPATATMLAGVEGYFNDPDRSGTYRFQVTPIEPPEDDFGNTVETASPTSVSETTSGLLNYQADVDVFSLDVEAGKTYFLDMRVPDGISQIIRILNEDGNWIGGGSFQERVTWTAFETGTAFIELTAWDAQRGSYTLSIGVDDGNTLQTATDVDVPVTLNTEFHVFGDVDFFAFEASEGAIYEVTTEHGTVDETIVSVYDSAGNMVTSNDDENAYSSTARAFFQPEQAGTYYVSVSGLDRLGSYQLNIQDASIVDIVAPDRPDDANTFADATAVEVPSVTTADVGTPEDIDWFSFMVEDNSFVSISTQHGLDLNTAFTVFGSDGTTVVAESIETDSLVTTSRLVLANLEAGTYFVALDALPNQTGGYQLEIEPIVISDDHDNDISEATRFDPGQQQVGRINYGADTDWLRATARRERRYEIRLDATTASSVHARILGRDRETLLGEITATPGEPAFLVDTPERSGSYFVEVTGAKGDYQLSVSEDDHGSVAATATPVMVNVPTRGNVETQTDEDWFAFEANFYFQYQVEVASTGNLFETTLRVVNSEGLEMAFDPEDGEQGSSVLWAPTFDGTYYAIVEGGYDFYTGEFSVVVNEQPRTLPHPGPNDLDGNGQIGEGDLNILTAAVRSGLSDQRYDLNVDGAVDRLDIDAFLAANNITPGDGDLDGEVTFNDLWILSQSFGAVDAFWSQGDYSGDGVVDFEDYLVLAANFDEVFDFFR